MSTKVQTTKVITGKNTRFSYLNANEPKSINGSTPKYSVSLIIPKDDIETVNKIKAAIELAYKEVRQNSKAMGKQYQHFLSLKHHSVMVTSSVLMMTLIAMPTSSMPIHHTSQGSLTGIVKRLSTPQNSTPVSTDVPLSPSMPLTLMATRVSPAV